MPEIRANKLLESLGRKLLARHEDTAAAGRGKPKPKVDDNSETWLKSLEEEIKDEEAGRLLEGIA